MARPKVLTVGAGLAGFHRARVRTASDWLMHAALGDDFTRLVLPDPMSGTLAGQEATGQYLSADDARPAGPGAAHLAPPRGPSAGRMTKDL